MRKTKPPVGWEHVKSCFPVPNILLDMDLPFHKIGVATLTCSLIDRNREAWRETLSLLDEDALRRVMARAAEKGVGIELNADDMRFFTEEEAELARRPYRAAKAAGSWMASSEMDFRFISMTAFFRPSLKRL